MTTEATLSMPEPTLKSRMAPLVRGAATTFLPIVAAILAGALVLALAGADPWGYYGYILQRGTRQSGIEAMLVYATPMLIIGAALIISFRAGLWNLGIDGQVLVGTLAAGICAPWLADRLPAIFALPLTMVIAMAAGALWAFPMAALKAYQGINEVISGLMMGFLATSLCDAIIKLFAGDPASYAPRTYSLAVEDQLPRMFDTTVTIGLVVAIIILVGTHFIMKRTALGLRTGMLGHNQANARHVGINVPRLMLIILCLSGALGGLAGAMDVVGVLGNMQAGWSPGYGFAVVPLVFLARMNGFAVMIFVAAYSLLHVGSVSAATRMGVPQEFTLVLVGLLLAFLALAEFLDHRYRGARS